LEQLSGGGSRHRFCDREIRLSVLQGRIERPDLSGIGGRHWAREGDLMVMALFDAPAPTFASRGGSK